MLDFPRFARDYSIPTISQGHHHCHEGWLQTHCPFCTDGRHGWHLGWSTSRGGFNCWRCGPQRASDVLAALSHTGRPRGLELFATYSGGAPTQRAPRGTTRRHTCATPPGLGCLLPRHLRYLRSRGLTDAEGVAEEWNLRGTCHLSRQWNWRVVAPICNRQGGVVAYVGRSIDPAGRPKYLLTDDEACSEDPKSFLYGVHKVPGDSVIVVEGPGDVWNVGPGAVATMGIVVHEPQIQVLRGFHRRFVMFDPDPRAQARARCLAETLSMFGGETEVIEGLPSDPGSLEKRQVRKVRALLRRWGCRRI